MDAGKAGKKAEAKPGAGTWRVAGQFERNPSGTSANVPEILGLVIENSYRIATNENINFFKPFIVKHL
jgi:hypothetical protein